MNRLFSFGLILTLLIAGCAPIMPTPTYPVTEPSDTPAPEVITTQIVEPARQGTLPNVFFDDFSYPERESMTANGWVIRSGQGWPGVTGATFKAEKVTFVQDPALDGNFLMRMTSSTAGAAENTFQTQVCHQRKYQEGTYAARVRFSDAPVKGPDGDQVVETFYAITPYREPLDPNYSEMDFEYLPNGGWGLDEHTLAVTSWETVQIEPWNADNTSNNAQGSLDGWHILLIQVADGSVRYFLDGTLFAEHGGNYYPDAPMSINFNLWFINGGLNASGMVREYQEDVDWVFFESGVVLSLDEVLAKLNSLREKSIIFQDMVPAVDPPLPSPCDL